MEKIQNMQQMEKAHAIAQACYWLGLRNVASWYKKRVWDVGAYAPDVAEKIVTSGHEKAFLEWARYAKDTYSSLSKEEQLKTSASWGRRRISKAEKLTQ